MSVRSGRVLLGATVVVAVALWAALAVESRSPEDVGALSLAKIERFPSDSRPFAQAARKRLEALGESPGDFFAVPPTDIEGPTIELPIWHEDAFGLISSSGVGNPGGKSRTMTFNRDAQLLSDLLWK